MQRDNTYAVMEVTFLLSKFSEPHYKGFRFDI